MKQYVGITLGPIGETIELTSTPAGLWAASYLFSYLAHDIRKNIGKEGLIQDDYNYENGKTVNQLFMRGVGLYHDRIIYEADKDHDESQACVAVYKAVNKIIDEFTKCFDYDSASVESFFDSYFNIHIVSIDVGDEDNFLISVNDALDASELEKNFASEITRNPILDLFDNKGDNEKRNAAIKNSFLVKSLRKWVLLNDESRIKDLPYIASGKPCEAYNAEDKASCYYAVIRADGDNMGATIKSSIYIEDDYIEFSKKCFKYGCKTAEIVLKYGGIPIYVGGDDLLCIAPLIVKVEGEKKTFLDMIKEISKAFKEEFTLNTDLSFGVQIQYEKAPLYEALDKSATLLFGKAKHNKPGALAINLEKHSGQSAEILIKRFSNPDQKITEILNELIKKHASERTLKSVGKHVNDYSVLLDNACKTDGNTEHCSSINNYYENVFDNNVSKDEREYIDIIRDLTVELARGENDKVSDEVGAYIRLVKFFSEKKEREEILQ